MSYWKAVTFDDVRVGNILEDEFGQRCRVLTVFRQNKKVVTRRTDDLTIKVSAVWTEEEFNARKFQLRKKRG